MPASDSVIAFVTQPQRQAIWSDAGLKIEYPSAREVEIETLLLSALTAQSEATHQGGLFGVGRELFEMSLPMAEFDLVVGETYTLEDPEFGLAGGRDFLLVGQKTDPARAVVIAEFWG